MDMDRNRKPLTSPTPLLVLQRPGPSRPFHPAATGSPSSGSDAEVARPRGTRRTARSFRSLAVDPFIKLSPIALHQKSPSRVRFAQKLQDAVDGQLLADRQLPQVDPICTLAMAC